MPRLTISIPDELGGDTHEGASNPRDARGRRSKRTYSAGDNRDEPPVARWLSCWATADA